MLTKAGPDHILFIYAQYTPVDEPFNKKSTFLQQQKIPKKAFSDFLH